MERVALDPVLPGRHHVVLHHEREWHLRFEDAVCVRDAADHEQRHPYSSDLSFIVPILTSQARVEPSLKHWTTSRFKSG